VYPQFDPSLGDLTAVRWQVIPFRPTPFTTVTFDNEQVAPFGGFIQLESIEADFSAPGVRLEGFAFTAPMPVSLGPDGKPV
jgi:hypothetical protein